MEPSIAMGLVGVGASFGSMLATLYVARRGGTFRKRSLDLRIGGQRIVDGSSLTVVWGRPPDKGLAITSLEFQLKNQGKDTVDDIVVTTVLPRVLGGFSDDKGKPNIEFELTRGVAPGSSMKVERVGARDLIHFTFKSIHNQSGILMDIPLSLPAALASLHFAVPVRFKEGETAELLVDAQITIPIDILVMARDRKTQHFTLELEVYAPAVFGFWRLASAWLSTIVSQAKHPSSVSQRIGRLCRAVLGFHRCLLIMSQYHEVEIRDPNKKSKNKPFNALQEVPGTKRYAIGYLVSLFAFYKPLGKPSQNESTQAAR